MKQTKLLLTLLCTGFLFQAEGSNLRELKCHLPKTNKVIFLTIDTSIFEESLALRERITSGNYNYPGSKQFVDSNYVNNYNHMAVIDFENANSAGVDFTSPITERLINFHFEEDPSYRRFSKGMTMEYSEYYRTFKFEMFGVKMNHELYPGESVKEKYRFYFGSPNSSQDNLRDQDFQNLLYGEKGSIVNFAYTDYEVYQKPLYEEIPRDEWTKEQRKKYRKSKRGDEELFIPKRKITRKTVVYIEEPVECTITSDKLSEPVI